MVRFKRIPGETNPSALDPEAAWAWQDCISYRGRERYRPSPISTNGAQKNGCAQLSYGESWLASMRTSRMALRSASARFRPSCADATDRVTKMGAVSSLTGQWDASKF